MDSAKINFRLIKAAYSALNKKKFQEAIAILEQVLASGSGDIYVLLLLSVAYLHTDQFGKLARFIAKIREKNPGYLPLIQLEAFLKLKSLARYDDALKLYLDLAAKFPADTHIYRGKSLIIDNSGDFKNFQKDARLQDFVYIPRPEKTAAGHSKKPPVSASPPRPAAPFRKGIHVSRTLINSFFIIAGVALLVTAGVWYFSHPGLYSKKSVKMKKTSRDFSDIDMISVSGTDYDLIKNVKRNTVPVYYQSAYEMTADFNRARQLIKSEKYNEALAALNGLYNSNVNFVVKEKVDFLIKFIIASDERDFADIPYGKVNAKKHMFRGYAIRWKGTIGRIKEKDDSQIFTFNVGGGDKGETGKADVFSAKIIPGLRRGSNILLEGVIVDFIGKDRTIYINSKKITFLR